jgi:hypothetical protein
MTDQARSVPDLTVIICTRDRAASLQATLEGLVRTDRAGVHLDVRVVDNAGDAGTERVVRALAGQLPLHYLVEPTTGEYGKSHALNRALAAGGLGELVAVLDDDMSVEPGWCQGVLATARRWPQADLFTGRSHVHWPDDSPPAWVHHPILQGWLFSVIGCPEADRQLEPGTWYSGNHFWFRSRVLCDGRRFEDTWLTEPCFMLTLTSAGSLGIQGPDAVVGHRIQPGLLVPEEALRRARRIGASFPEVALDPRFRTPHGQLAQRHPLLARAYAAAEWFRWKAQVLRLGRATADCRRFGDRVYAVGREAHFRQTWKILTRRPEYRLFRRRGSASLEHGSNVRTRG